MPELHNCSRPRVAILAREDQRSGAVLVLMRDVRTIVQEQSHRRLVAYSGVQIRMQSCRFSVQPFSCQSIVSSNTPGNTRTGQLLNK